DGGHVYGCTTDWAGVYLVDLDANATLFPPTVELVDPRPLALAASQCAGTIHKGNPIIVYPIGFADEGPAVASERVGGIWRTSDIGTHGANDHWDLTVVEGRLLFSRSGHV